MTNYILAPEHASDALNHKAAQATGFRRSGPALAAAGLLLFVWGLQILSGGYHADFDSNGDEPAHVVSSLMVRDYFVSGNLTHPWEFATNFYVHYPKVAILHWPPLFHAGEAMWMLVAGRSRFGLLSFQALLAATLVISLFFWMRRNYGLWLALLSALVLAATPTMQDAAKEVSPDLLLAVLVFWATAQYGLYIATKQLRHAWWAALLAVAALCTHGRAAVLFMVPVITLLLVRVTKWRIAAAVAIVLVYVFVPALMGQAYSYSPANTLANSLGYWTRLASALNWYVFALALVGMAACFRAQPRAPVTAITALVLSCWIFYSVVNVPFAEFFLVTSIPGMIVLAAVGAHDLLRGVASFGRGARLPATALAALTLGFAAWNVYRMPLKNDQAAQRIVGDNTLYHDRQKIWMVAGSDQFEGSLIAEVALRDRAQDHIVLRASKMLASSTWSGAHYRMVFHDLSSVLNLLDRDQVGWIISQGSAKGTQPCRQADAGTVDPCGLGVPILSGFLESDTAPHILQLDAAIASNYPAWQRVWLAGDPSAGINYFKRTAALAGHPKIEIDMSNKFGSSFRLHE